MLSVNLTRSIGLALVIPGMIVCAPIGSHHLESDAATDAARVQAPAIPAPPGPPETFAPSLPTPPEPEAGDPHDLYGNEVTSALAKYRLDSTGSLFELHSPQIEMPRLPSPKS